MVKVDNSFWLGRWERDEIGWHQDEVEPHLERHFSELAPTRVLVPLCGKSKDLLWLARRGHEVIGIELSDKACRGFFADNGLPHAVTPGALFNVHRGAGVTLLQGDFFKLKPSALGTIGAIYDRAALIAMPPGYRSAYGAHLRSLAERTPRPESFSWLQITIERVPEDLVSGPPFSVTRAEVDRLYGATYDVVERSREPTEISGATTPNAVEVVYTLVTSTKR